MIRQLLLFGLILQLLAFEVNASNAICRHFYTNTYLINDVIASWYKPIDFGDNEMIGRIVNGQRVLEVLKPIANNYPYYQDFGNPRMLIFRELGYSVRFMPGSPISGSHYYSVESLVPSHFLPHMSLLQDPKKLAQYRAGKGVSVGKFDSTKPPKKNALLSSSMVELYDSSDLEKIENLVNYDLTWQTYQAEGTVDKREIKSFKITESNLDPRRKVTFELSVPIIRNGKIYKKTLSIMRVYDGSPFPTTSFSDFPTHHEAIKTDPRVPIERRYPGTHFREETEFIFEPGRLAKSEEIEGPMLEYQFYSLASYLHNKFGLRGLAPRSYVEKGKVMIEITGRNLEKFMRSRSENGYGFILDYIVKDTGKGAHLVKVNKNTTYDSLMHSFEETETKYILHSTVADFIKNFMGMTFKDID